MTTSKCIILRVKWWFAEEVTCICIIMNLGLQFTKKKCTLRALLCTFYVTVSFLGIFTKSVKIEFPYNRQNDKGAL